MSERTLYDAGGRAIAYIADDGSSIYLWHGEAVTYLEGDELYGWNGRHLGWFDDGVVYDSSGHRVGFVREACPVVTHVEPVKSVKQVQRVKCVRHVAWVKPVFQLSTSPQPLVVFLESGR